MAVDRSNEVNCINIKNYFRFFLFNSSCKSRFYLNEDFMRYATLREALLHPSLPWTGLRLYGWRKGMEVQIKTQFKVLFIVYNFIYDDELFQETWKRILI